MLFTTVTAGLRRVVSVQQKSLKRLPMELVHLSDACIDCIGACRIPQAETLKNPIKQSQAFAKGAELLIQIVPL